MKSLIKCGNGESITKEQFEHRVNWLVFYEGMTPQKAKKLLLRDAGLKWDD